MTGHVTGQRAAGAAAGADTAAAPVASSAVGGNADGAAAPPAVGPARRKPNAGLARAGLGPGGMRTLYILGVFSGLKAVGFVMLAGALAQGIVGVIAGDDSWQDAIVLGVVAAILRAAAHWATQAFAAREALVVKEKTRQELADRLVNGGTDSVGAMTTLATHGLDELDKYYSVVLPAMTSAVVIPLVVGARILFADWVSALIIVLTIPLIPIFMALIGMHTQDRVSAASASLSRLSDHLVELARGLPVLVGLGRVEEQTAALAKISDDYRKRTMFTLRTAFMSSLALELIATISVALVAVFIGMRLVNGTMPLEIGLLVLILAPECYAPFRDMGAAFHAAQDGVLAQQRARTIIEAPLPVDLVEPGDAIVVTDLTVTYEGRRDPAVDHASFAVPAGSITALLGASGAGKSTILAVLAGRLRTQADAVVVTGRVTGIDTSALAWVPQHPHTVGSTVRGELRLYGSAVTTTSAAVELEARIDELLRSLGLTATADADPAQLSPGELRRVAVARALLRVDAGATLLLMDEPTAHVDADSAAVIQRTIADLRGTVTIVLASHDVAVTDLATTRIHLGDTVGNHTSGADLVGLQELRAATPARSTVSTVAADSSAAPAAPAASAAGTASTTSTTSTTGTTHTTDFADAGAADVASAHQGPGVLRLLLRIVRPAGWRFVFAVLLGVAAALFAVSLTAVSGWLIVRASSHPSMMYLMVAIVGVRFFGIGRSALRYAERLQTHDGIFASLTALRVRIWRSLAERGTTSRKLLRGGTALDYLVVTVDQVRDLAPRVLFPPIVGALSGVAAIIAVAILHPAAVPLLVASLVVSLVIAPAVSLWADRRASRGQLLIRSSVARRFAALLSATEDLRINAVDASVRRDLRELDARAGADARRSAWALGLGGSLVVLANCVTAALMLIVCAPAVAAGTLEPEIVAVLVLLPLGLLEPLLGVVDAVQQWPALAQAVRRLAPFTPGAPDVALASNSSTDGSAAVGAALAGGVRSIELRELAARWPDAPDTVFTDLDARVTTGEWLVVSGPSGSGKSTLLSVLLGYLTPAAGSYLVDGNDSRDVDPAELRRHIAWAPQEGHLFDSTLRANLLLARSHADAPSEDEMFEVLRRVGLGAFVATLPEGLDTRVGSEGAQLSGGQRQRVAVARTLLTRAEVVLLDEPTAHLDADGAAHLMADLRDALSDKVAVLVTHHTDDIAPTDELLQLARARVSV